MKRIRDHFEPELINLHLDSTSQDEVIAELVSMLNLDQESETSLTRNFIRRQNLASSGVGGFGWAYGYSQAVSQVRVGFGRKLEGIDFNALDSKPVYFFFLLTGPPDMMREFLETQVKIYHFYKEPDVPDLLAKVETVEDFLQLVDAKDKGES